MDSSNVRGLLDTSVFIAGERGRALGAVPSAAAISVVTLAELHIGVLMADQPEVRAARLRTLTMVQRFFEPLTIDIEVARTFGELTAQARREGRRLKILDTWIAATAMVNDLTLYTQDDDFLAIPKVRVVKV